MQNFDTAKTIDTTYGIDSPNIKVHTERIKYLERLKVKHKITKGDFVLYILQNGANILTNDKTRRINLGVDVDNKIKINLEEII